MTRRGRPWSDERDSVLVAFVRGASERGLGVKSACREYWEKHESKESTETYTPRELARHLAKLERRFHRINREYFAVRPDEPPTADQMQEIATFGHTIPPIRMRVTPRTLNWFRASPHRGRKRP